MDANTEILRKQVMVSHFMNTVGCEHDQATQLLQSAQWQLEVALSLFFQGHNVGVPSTHPPHHSHNQPHSAQPSNPSYTPNASSSSQGSSLGSRMSYQACVPTNTPATPPQFPDTLAAFAQLQTSSPAENSTGILQEPTIVRCQTQASNS